MVDWPAPPLWMSNGVTSVWSGVGKLIHAATYGYASIEYNSPMELSTRFQVASNSKLFCTVAIYQLQEQGKLNVSDAINLYLNQTDFAYFGFPNITTWCPQVGPFPLTGPCQNITFIQLMSMSSGIISVDSCPSTPTWVQAYCMDPMMNFYPPGDGKLGGMIGYFINAPLQTAPSNNTFDYANPNWWLLSYLVQKLSGQTYDRYLKQHIFDIVGLNDTFGDATNGQYTLRSNVATNYYKYWEMNANQTTYRSLGTGRCSFGTVSSLEQGAADLYSNVNDLAKWYLSLFVFKNTSVLSEASLLQIVRPYTYIKTNHYYAQGIFVTYANTTNTWPDVIYYTGSFPCSTTSNILNFTSTVPYFSAAYANAPVVNMSEQDYNNAANFDNMGDADPGTFMKFGNNMFGDPTHYNKELVSWAIEHYPSGILPTTTSTTTIPLTATTTTTIIPASTASVLTTWGIVGIILGACFLFAIAFAKPIIEYFRRKKMGYGLLDQDMPQEDEQQKSTVKWGGL